ncbi:MAG TPA: hypothetical protein VEB86_19805 [Chryseosolibacter sp.]|nr:hypothetical protein [Chryseosolibacter sp.]
MIFTCVAITACALVFFLYCNSLDRVNPLTRTYYHRLKTELKRKGYQTQLVVMSSRRTFWHNKLLTWFGASSKSRHLTGDAVDILVLDVNNDQAIDGKDVDIIYGLLDQKIVHNTGGVGTYKTETPIWNRQMVHLDCRKTRTRWHR